jgi:hypothetical protein
VIGQPAAFVDHEIFQLLGRELNGHPVCFSPDFSFGRITQKYSRSLKHLKKFSNNKIDFRLESLENQETYRSYIQLEEYCFGICRNDNDCLAFSLDNSADLLNCIFIKHSENLNSE